jgi:hypothetical protein
LVRKTATMPDADPVGTLIVPVVALFPPLSAVTGALRDADPVKLSDPPLIPSNVAPVTATDTVLAPAAGLARENSWMNPTSWAAPPDSQRSTEVIATPLYVAVAASPVSVSPKVASTATPTSSSVAPAAQVWDQVSGLVVPPAPELDGPTASNTTATGHPPSAKAGGLGEHLD